MYDQKLYTHLGNKETLRNVIHLVSEFVQYCLILQQIEFNSGKKLANFHN